MLQLIETICLEKSEFQRINLHEVRMNSSRLTLFGSTDHISLEPLLCLPESMEGLKVRCRVTYAEAIENIEYEPYVCKNIGSLKLVWDDSIDYSFKYRNREALKNLLDLRGEEDEILIVKDGLITDTSFTNIVFLRNGIWYTPEFPLLAGTRRANYLERKLITPASIGPGDLYRYEEARLINAMRSLEEAEPISISEIR